LLKKVALDHPLVSKTPTPEAYFVKVDGASHVFELRLWTAEVGSLGRIKSDLAITFQNALVAPPANQLK
jgi:small-conductance mechanosensitive channel